MSPSLAYDARAELERLRSENARLKGGGGDGTSDDVNARLKALEGDLKEIRADLKVMIKDVAEIKGRISQMPGTLTLLGFIVTVVVATGLLKHFFP